MNYAIIAAGEGSRLSQEGVKVPKPLVKIQDECLIDRLIRIFMQNDAEHISVICNDLTSLVSEHLFRLEEDGLKGCPVPLDNDVLDVQAFRSWLPEYKNAQFIYSDGSTDEDNPYIGQATPKQYICGWAVEKMSKSMFNVVNPDDIVAKYGADTLRLYEMFLGPLEMSKPWDTNGIDGVHRFLKKLWNQFENLSDDEPTPDELRSLHKLIKKVTWDIEHFSFNTSIPAFMIAQSELSKCSKKQILKQFAVLLAPYAPHIAEEMFSLCGGVGTVFDAKWPECNEKYLEESNVKYPVQFNGKVRFTIELPKTASREEVEKAVLQDEQTPRFLNGGSPKKIIVVPGKIVNIVM